MSNREIKQQTQSIFTAEEYKQSFVRNKKGKKEEKVQLQVCDYLRHTYPDLIWFCDLASGLKLPIWLGVLHAKMRSSRGLPDLFIAKPKWEYAKGEGVKYNGLFIELKRDGIRLKNGEMPKTPHIKEQAEILARLNQQGYKSCFAAGAKEAIDIINEYLK